METKLEDAIQLATQIKGLLIHLHNNINRFLRMNPQKTIEVWNMRKPFDHTMSTINQLLETLRHTKDEANQIQISQPQQSHHMTHHEDLLDHIRNCRRQVKQAQHITEVMHQDLSHMVRKMENNRIGTELLLEMETNRNEDTHNTVNPIFEQQVKQQVIKFLQEQRERHEAENMNSQKHPHHNLAATNGSPERQQEGTPSSSKNYPGTSSIIGKKSKRDKACKRNRNNYSINSSTSSDSASDSDKHTSTNKRPKTHWMQRDYLSLQRNTSSDENDNLFSEYNYETSEEEPERTYQEDLIIEVNRSRKHEERDHKENMHAEEAQIDVIEISSDAEEAKIEVIEIPSEDENDESSSAPNHTMTPLTPLNGHASSQSHLTHGLISARIHTKLTSIQKFDL